VGLPETPGFTVVGAGDIAHTGDADIVVQNETTGQILYANMVGGAFSNWVAVGTTPGWSVTAVEDVMGNGYDDIVIQNQSTGQIDYANMSGGVFNNWVSVAAAPGYSAHTAAGAMAGAASSTMFDQGSVANAIVQPGPTATANILHVGAV
jgi:hypothetical protein